MKLQFILLFLMLGISLSIKSQEIFFIGQKAYQSTNSFTLKSNMSARGHDLKVLFAKDNQNGLIVISTEISDDFTRIRGNINIYLDDASVISCIDRGRYDFVDGFATTVYNLTKEELLKLSKSNLSTIRFSIKCYTCTISSEEGNFSASNKETSRFNLIMPRTDVPKLIKGLFEL